MAIGVGLNVAPPPDVATGTGLRAGATRLRALGLLVPAIRRAGAARGALLPHERTAWEARDLALGRPCVSPLAGIVAGVSPDGALLVRTDDGTIAAAHGGSLVFADESHAPEGIT